MKVNVYIRIQFRELFKTFSTNVPLMDKPGSWFLLAKSLKNTSRRVIFSVKMQAIDLLVKTNYVGSA